MTATIPPAAGTFAPAQIDGTSRLQRLIAWIGVMLFAALGWALILGMVVLLATVF